LSASFCSPASTTAAFLLSYFDHLNANNSITNVERAQLVQLVSQGHPQLFSALAEYRATQDQSSFRANVLGVIRQPIAGVSNSTLSSNPSKEGATSEQVLSKVLLLFAPLCFPPKQHGAAVQ
jgi:hypothetical protein